MSRKGLISCPAWDGACQTAQDIISTSSVRCPGSASWWRLASRVSWCEFREANKWLSGKRPRHPPLPPFRAYRTQSLRSGSCLCSWTFRRRLFIASCRSSWNRRACAVSSSHLGRIRLDLVPADLAPHDEPHARSRGVAERHRWTRVRRCHRQSTECGGRCRGALNRSPRPSFCE